MDQLFSGQVDEKRARRVVAGDSTDERTHVVQHADPKVLLPQSASWGHPYLCKGTHITNGSNKGELALQKERERVLQRIETAQDMDVAETMEILASNHSHRDMHTADTYGINMGEKHEQEGIAWEASVSDKKQWGEGLTPFVCSDVFTPMSLLVGVDSLNASADPPWYSGV